MTARDLDTERAALELFETALDWPLETRDAQLEEVCTGNRALLAAVRRLLAHDARAGDLLPTVPPAAGDAMSTREFTSALPERVGPYRLTRLLGMGGMGVVWQAERDDGLFEQTVAVKFVRNGVFAQAAAARFAEERRVLAKLTHPGIARLIDGGSDDTGRAYLVMEYVDGVPITDYVARTKPTLAARLALFESVCEAVQAAHQSLVVHADIKPANILVTANGHAKLLDFGIARLLRDDDEHADAASSATPMTRAFAAPERLAGHAATIAGDVYGLGALLHLLFGGSVPNDAEPTIFERHGTRIAVPRWLPPSVAVGSAQAETSNASTVPAIDAASLRGDLDAIVQRALRTDPAQRYGTVAALLEDLRRYREHLPVTARADAGSWYRFGKFVRRRRGVFAVATTLFIGLTSATVFSTLQYVGAERARADASARFEQTRRMADYMIFDVDSQLARLPGSLPLRQDLVERSHAYLAKLATDPRASPALRLDVAKGYARLARIYGLDPNGGIGDLAHARASLRAANDMLTRVTHEAPDLPGLAVVRADTLLVQANDLMIGADAARLRSALATLDAAGRQYDVWLRDHPHDVDAQHGRWRCALMRGRLLVYASQPSAGIEVTERELARKRDAPRTPAQQIERDFLGTASYLILAESKVDAKHPSIALADYRNFQRALEAVIAAGRGGADTQYMYSSAFLGIGDMLALTNDTQGATAAHEHAVQLLRDLVRAGPNAAVQQSLALAEARLAANYASAHDAARARDLMDHSERLLRALARTTPADGSYLRLLALHQYTRALIERRLATGGDCARTRGALQTFEDLHARFGVVPLDTGENGPLPRLRAWAEACLAAHR